MSQEGLIEVIGRDGWRKEFALRKAIAFIGSDPSADIPLEGSLGAGIAGRHLQLIAVPEAGYRLVNLGESEIFLGAAADRAVAPRFSAELNDGEQIKVGDFTLVFHSEAASAGVITGEGGLYRHSPHIGLRVNLPQKQIAPYRTLEGIITVANLGDHPAAQFELELDGLERAYFELEPGPLLSSGAEKEVLFRLYHRGPKPLAGDYRLTIYAAAPRAYAAEQISLSQTVKFLPLYEHKLTLMPAGVKPAPPAAPEEPPPAPAAPGLSQNLKPETPAVSSSPPTQSEVVTVEATPVPAPPTAASPSWWVRLRQKFFPARSEAAEPAPPEIVIAEAAAPVVAAPPEPSKPPESPAGWWGDQAAPESPPAAAATSAGPPPGTAEPEEIKAETPAVEPAPPPDLPSPPSPAQAPEEPAPAAPPPPAPEPPPPVIRVQPPAPAASEDWWQAGSPPAKTEPPPAADWWAAPRTEPPARPDSRPVLKLKATPETPPEEPAGSDAPPTSQDWWTPPANPARKQKSKSETED